MASPKKKTTPRKSSSQTSTRSTSTKPTSAVPAPTRSAAPRRPPVAKAAAAGVTIAERAPPPSVAEGGEREALAARCAAALEQLELARADSRAARDEVVRLWGENDRLRARLDQPPPAAVSSAPSSELAEVRTEARLLRSELTAVREELERSQAVAARARAQELAAARAAQGALDEAQAEAARLAAEVRELRQRLTRFTDGRGGR